ncbi:hypothetical protein PYR71_06950 [Rhizobium sp. MC63]|uniref:Uncharacterized protein n=1 Tax=Rhizobium mulingense TaxID=3031128 RepID=A0ACC6MRJ0_9HYPH|nr:MULTISPECIES: hypothetical protein [unclassified Rhizobium]MDF0696256.1 hypothetical protein [Rhizobium sp. MC63]MEA3515924.1 hypothetical protein [Rhizobium sp. MJ31]
MPCDVTINVTGDFTAFTVDDGYSPYVDKSNKKLENLTVVGSATFYISVPLDSNNEGVVFVRATNAKSVTSSSTYNIPDDCAPGGNIYVPKISAASQSDLDNLDAKVNALAQQIAGNKRGK